MKKIFLEISKGWKFVFPGENEGLYAILKRKLIQGHFGSKIQKKDSF